MKQPSAIETARAYAFYLASRGSGDYTYARRNIPVPRFRAKAGKSFTRQQRVKANPRSMMNAQHPSGLRPVIQQDERTRVLFIAYRSRVKSRKNAPSFDRAPVSLGR